MHSLSTSSISSSFSELIYIKTEFYTKKVSEVVDWREYFVLN